MLLQLIIPDESHIRPFNSGEEILFVPDVRCRKATRSTNAKAISDEVEQPIPIDFVINLAGLPVWEVRLKQNCERCEKQT